MNIAVASGKGGTGKTTVAVSMALALHSDGIPVTLLDCDVEEPNAHIFMNPRINETTDVFLDVPEIDREKCTFCGRCADLCVYNALLVTDDSILFFEELCHGCGGCQHFCPTGAVGPGRKKIGIVEKGVASGMPFVQGCLDVGVMLSPSIIDEVRKAEDRRGVTIIDAPPGTSCPVLHSVRGVDFCLLVTEPTPFGLNDLDLAVQMARALGIPYGVVINRARDGFGIIEKYCRKKGLKVLMKIPLNQEIAVAYSKGIPLVGIDISWEQKFRDLYRDIGERVAHEGINHNQR